MKRIAIAIILTLCSFSAWADRDLIRIDLSNGCPPTVRDDEPRAEDQCKGQNACRRPGEIVRWEIVGASAEQFSLSFSNTSIFENYNQGLCRSSSGSANKIQCRISPGASPGSSSNYDVSIGSCLMDPTIIIH